MNTLTSSRGQRAAELENVHLVKMVSHFVEFNVTVPAPGTLHSKPADTGEASRITCEPRQAVVHTEKCGFESRNGHQFEKVQRLSSNGVEPSGSKYSLPCGE